MGVDTASASRRLRHAALVVLAMTAPGLGVSAAAQTLTIGVTAEASSVDPHFTLLAQNLQICRQIYEPLILQDEQQRLTPGLAVSWAPIADTVWEFKLRQGVTFHDGSPFTADDVAFTLERAPNVPNSPNSFKLYTRQIQAVTVVDPYTVRFRTEKPYPLMPNDLSAMGIISRKASSAATTQDFNAGRGAVGTGPYRFVEWVPGDRVVMERNPAYWGRKPDWQRVIYKPITQDSARVAALLSGAVDLIDYVPTPAIDSLRQRAGFSLSQVTTNRVIFLHLDSHRAVSPYVVDAQGRPLDANPLRDRRVRLAMSKAIDRKAIVAQVMDGVAIPAGQVLPDGYFGVSPRLKPEAYDPEGAKKLLAEAGYPDGFTISLQAPNDRFLNDDKTALAVAQMLGRVGIQTRVELAPGLLILNRRKSYDLSMYLWVWGSETGEPSSALRGLLASVDPARGRGNSNAGRYSNPEMDRLLDQALATVEDDKRSQLLQQATEAAMNDVGMIPVHFLMAVWGMRKGLAYEGRTDAYTLASDVRAVKGP